jgi:hypothetical protein
LIAAINAANTSGTPTAIPSDDLSGANTLVTLDITSSNPSPHSFAATDSSGNTVLAAPDVSSVPEPRTLILFALGLAGLAVAGGWQRRPQFAAR